MKILIIQTAFIGDVILATPIVEKLHQHYPDSRIDFLLRKGNESLLDNHPHLNEVIIFDKQKNKYRNLTKIVRKIRSNKYDMVINVQRFFTTGWITIRSGAKEKIGFNKNPLSFAFTHSVAHHIKPSNPSHEVERNLSLIEEFTDNQIVSPKLYPSDEDFSKVQLNGEYVCFAPASVWFTKQFPEEKWIELINSLNSKYMIYLVGGPDDKTICDSIKSKVQTDNIEVMADKLTLLQSAALMKGAVMNYVNDAAPMHLASAMNAPVTAIYCSTIPEFGFGPLSDNARTVETLEDLDCRPCGLHGRNACPKGHFRCSNIAVDRILADL